MKSILYFGYFILNTDYRQLADYFREVKKNEQASFAKILLDMIISSFKYKASFLDYFLFKFYEKDHEQRDSYITTGRLYEFYTEMNDQEKIDNFSNKAKFNKIFKEFMHRDYLFLDDNCTMDLFCNWVSDKKCIIAKPNTGVAGRGIEKIYVNNYRNNLDRLYSYLKEKKLDLIEECIEQHEDMNRLNSLSVNSIRVITVRWQGRTDIIGAVLRMSIDRHVDNFAAGGIAAPVDIKKGVVSGPAISKKLVVYEEHPKTKCIIKGFKIPYWDEAVEMVIKASEVVPEVRTVGWDVAITETGPELIEGNNNWNKDTFQMAYREGKQYLLDKYYLEQN